MPPGERERAGVGSGVIIDAQGHIVTNLHVVKGADEITVRFHDKKEVAGKIVGTDAATDLAVVRIPAGEAVVAAKLGDSDRIEVGQWAIAIGSPFGLEQTVTVGVVSATGRSDTGIVQNETLIQTDASINPGNSGGPLLNAQGEVIGINTAILSSGQGIGFAIPINTAQRVASALISRGRVVRGWLGVSLEPLNDDLAEALGAPKGRGAVVKRVLSGGPAEKAGLLPNDVVVRFGEATVGDLQHLQRLVLDAPVDRPVSLRVLRQGKEVTRIGHDRRGAAGAARGVLRPFPLHGLFLAPSPRAGDRRAAPRRGALASGGEHGGRRLHRGDARSTGSTPSWPSPRPMCFGSTRQRRSPGRG